MDALFEVKTIDEEKFFYDRVFPLTISPKSGNESLDDTLTKIKDNKQLIVDSLTQHGAILFRGFPIRDANDFNRFILAFDWKDMPYLGGIATRTNVVGVVHTA